MFCGLIKLERLPLYLRKRLEGSSHPSDRHSHERFLNNADGQRISKTVDGVTTEFIYAGDILAGQKTGDDILMWIYDNNGSYIGFTYNGVEYYYVYNLQGDVVAITDSTGTIVAKYEYDTWGEVQYEANYNGTVNIAVINPIRYRGYYYDSERGLYYLNSRYYDPFMCRFLNADLQLNSQDGMNGMNVFAYCVNNPLMFSDPCGTCIHRWYLLGLVDCKNCKAKKATKKVEEAKKRVIYDVPAYTQGDTNLCWAYCQVMYDCYNNGEKLTQRQADTKAKEIAIAKHGSDYDRSAFPDNCGPETVNINDIELLFDILKSAGPVYAYYSNGFGAHMVVVTGVDLNTGTVYTNNPAYGSGAQSFDEFVDCYTRKAGEYQWGTDLEKIYLINNY